MKKAILGLLLFWVSLGANAQDQTNTFVHRTEKGAKIIFVKTDAMGEVLAISYQDFQDKTPVKLTIVKKTDERLYAKHPQTGKEIEFASTFAMGGAIMLPDGSAEEFYYEVWCKSSAGDAISSSGGPMFLPFWYRENEKALPTPVEMITEYPETDAEGNGFVNIKLPRRQGVYKLTYRYDENSKLILTLIDEKGKATVYQE